MSFPVSSVDVAAEEISYSPESPASATAFFMMNPTIGLRQIFPWQTKSIFFIVISLCISEEIPLIPQATDRHDIDPVFTPYGIFRCAGKYHKE